MPLLQNFFDIFVSTVGFLFVLSFLVIIHEMGHLLTAIWLKIGVEEFGIGYPPRAKVLFHWKKIPFTLNWLPFGGFVKMVGEDGPQDEESKKMKVGQPFYTKRKRARLTVLLAGVVINFLFGVLAFSIVYTVTGFPRLINERFVEAVRVESPAAQSGVLPNDRLEGAIDLSDSQNTRQTFQTTADVVNYVKEHLGKTIRLFVSRNGQEFQYDIYLRTESERPAGEGALGIEFRAPDVEFDFYPWWQMPFRAAVVGVQESIAFSFMILNGLGSMVSGLFFRGVVPKDVSGPLGIVHEATKVGLFQSSWDTVLRFAGMLSVNLAILNLLPIPALDGGRAFFVMLESVIGKKLRERIENKVNYAGFAFLLGLIVLISIKDIWGIFADIFKYFQG